jgi:1,4-dihydroxy-2-naphthoyl-CoA hydrolase
MKPNITPDMLNAGSQQSLVSHLGIEFIEVGPDFLRAKMPVDERTIQPFGLLHGGASVALAETVGSVASSLQIDLNEQICVGMEINANHVRSVRSGYVYGTARPIHLGRKTHIWEIKITDDAENLVSVSRLTMMILDK